MVKRAKIRQQAGVAELVDAPGLGPGDFTVIGVQVLSPAPLGFLRAAKPSVRKPYVRRSCEAAKADRIPKSKKETA
jgi:hypothetical protein